VVQIEAFKKTVNINSLEFIDRCERGLHSSRAKVVRVSRWWLVQQFTGVILWERCVSYLRGIFSTEWFAT